ncbi:MAG TPA: AbrB/MazE/SpoVT family DNA-binding domain-containing protein [Candidatus Dormibacteraeota bacterium]|nr:AbrB/MazE/SpoVT family DNA-binding domain-containing protein [Candidatus Dormibacteraeota bacterium]
MKTQLSRWGNSLAVRIPKHVASAAKWKAGDTIELEVEDSGAVKLQKPEKKLTLKELVDGINLENVHAEVDWDEPRGNEVW